MHLTILFEFIYASLKKITNIRTSLHIFFLLLQGQFVMRKSLIAKKFQEVWFMNVLSKWRVEPKAERVQATKTPTLNSQGAQLLLRDDTPVAFLQVT